MNWDQQLINACTETDGTPHPHTDHVLTGAKWQRDQLRTNETLEPWARAIYTELSAKDPWAPKWESADEYARGAAYSRARGMINLLLGGQ